jgi:hypothetical protein
VVTDVAFVALSCGYVDIEQLEVSVHELVDRGLGARVSLLVDLVDEPGLGRLCFFERRGTGGDDLGEVDPLVGQRVDACVHLDAQGSTGQRLDLAALAPLVGLAPWCDHARILDDSHHVQPHKIRVKIVDQGSDLVLPAGFADCRDIPDRMVTAAAQAYRQRYATGVVTEGGMAGATRLARRRGPCRR